MRSWIAALALGGCGAPPAASPPEPACATGDCRDHVVQVAVGDEFGCARAASGRVHCWGRNHRGQLGRGDFSEDGRATVVLTDAIALAAGDAHACAVRVGGAVVCWGANDRYQTSRESGDWAGLRMVALPAPAVGVAAGRDRSCAWGGDETVWCWGAGVASPEHVAGKPPVDSGSDGVSASGRSSCALVDGAVRCSGVAAAGLRGIAHGRPVAVDRAGTLFAGGGSTCVVAVDSVRCHGQDGTTQVALGPVAALAIGERTRLLARPDGVVERWDGASPAPFPVPAGQLAAGDGFGCGLERGGTVVCAETDGGPVARPIRARSLAVGGRFACAVDQGGAVSCWEGAGGEPQTVAGLSPAIDVAVGPNLACATTADGVWCWNQWRGGMAAPTSPVSAGVVGAVQLALGMEHACALDGDGRVWCWGRNDAGQLGDGTTRGRTRAALVPGLGPARRIDAGHSHSCAELRDDTVWCWGHPAGLGLPVPRVDPASVVVAPTP